MTPRCSLLRSLAEECSHEGLVCPSVEASYLAQPYEVGAAVYVGRLAAPSKLVHKLMLDAEDWKIVFEVYKGHTRPALALAFQLTAIMQSLERGPKGIPDAVEALEVAIESLYPHTSFHQLGHRMFRHTLAGKMTPTEEDLIRRLGVKL